MQSNKTSSKKPREAAADVAVPGPEANTPAPVTKARKTAASTSPKKTSKTAAPAKRHRPAATPVLGVLAVPAEQSVQAEAGEMAIAPKVMAAASGGSATGTGLEVFHSDVVTSVGNMTEPQAIGAEDTPTSEKTERRPSVTSDQIARLAHSYWAERGYLHGLHEEDWLRAERDLQSRD